MDVPLPAPGPDELLVRHDAVGICFSDIKVHPRRRKPPAHPSQDEGRAGRARPRGGADRHRSRREPARPIQARRPLHRPGRHLHRRQDLCLRLRDRRAASRATASSTGVCWPATTATTCVPVNADDGYAEVALCEPWACVEASYTVDYRTQLAGGRRGLAGRRWRRRDVGRWPSTGARAKVVLDVSDAAFAAQVRAWAQASRCRGGGGRRRRHALRRHRRAGWRRRRCASSVFGRLANGGIFNVVLDQPFDRPVSVDIGRMHYDHLLRRRHRHRRPVGCLSAGAHAAQAGWRLPGSWARPGRWGRCTCCARLSLPGQAGQDRGHQPSRCANGAGAPPVSPARPSTSASRWSTSRSDQFADEATFLAPQAGRDGRRAVTTTS